MPVKLVEWRGSVPDEEDPALVGSANWCHHIPTLHRALANPTGMVEMPLYHKHMELFEACAYWETAVYLLHALLGWEDPGKGLQWWYKHDQEDFNDPRLQLLKQVWNSEGQIDLLAAWYWVQGGPGKGSLPFQIDDSAAESMKRRRGQDFLGTTWWEEFNRKYSGGHGYTHDPYFGGYNGLHLGHSGLSSYDPPGVLLRSGANDRKAVLLLDKARRWYAQLVQCGATLPSLGKSSWHVDVVVKPMGWLGTFRRSWVTGLWFQGRHLVHAAGN